jgi:Carboxypeptidase regulatory-like domain
MRRRFFLTIALIVPLLIAVGLWAQNAPKADTVIKGVVLGANGKPVAAAAVECQSSAGIRPRVVHTDTKGHYLITGLKQDAYDLRASSNRAYSDWEKNIPLKKGQTKEITLRLLNGNTALSGTLPAKQNQ